MKTKIYKNTLILITAFCALMLLCTQQSRAQATVIYDQSFNAAYPNWPSGWSSSSNKGWMMDTSTANASYVPTAGEYGYPGASGGAMVDIANPDNGDTGTYTVTSTGISTIGFDTITAIFGARQTSHFTDSGSVIKYFEWTSYSDGSWNTTWDTIPFTRSPADSYWHLCNDSAPITLPSGAAGQDSIKFRWEAFIHSNTRSKAASGTFRFDDFIVAGDISTGINNVNTVSPVSLYPNPASNFATINNIAGKNYTVRLTDVTGKTIKTVYISNSENRIDTSDMTPGFYMAQLISSDTNVQTQVIKLVIIR
jgi:hypothetical protein